MPSMHNVGGLLLNSLWFQQDGANHHYGLSKYIFQIGKILPWTARFESRKLGYIYFKTHIDLVLIINIKGKNVIGIIIKVGSLAFPL